MTPNRATLFVAIVLVRHFEWRDIGNISPKKLSTGSETLPIKKTRYARAV
jgi:hypothetical protein